MTAHVTEKSSEKSAELPCDRCGYDLRAHPHDAKCPECELPVAESLKWAGIPRRPAWRDSDPRWRRRMLAGMWILVLLPLADAIKTSGWASSVTVPNVFGFPGAIRLDETFLFNLGVYQLLVFCIGAVLLFSKERQRRRARLDWTRRWGVICSYVVLLLSAADILFIVALVCAGIAAVFISMPLKYQPGVTRLFVGLSWGYLRHGPYPKEISLAVVVAFSSITILLACVPLFDALRSTGPKWLAPSLLAPLALFSLMHLMQAGLYGIGLSGMTPIEMSRDAVYFWPELLVKGVAELATIGTLTGFGREFAVEAAKWCVVLAIVVWLSIAQFAAWWQGRQGNRSSDSEYLAEGH
jgi:hypothetical protein